MSCPRCPEGFDDCLACLPAVSVGAFADDQSVVVRWLPVGSLPWRVGTKVGRTIYDAQDRLIGVMDTASMAELVVEQVNKSVAP